MTKTHLWLDDDNLTACGRNDVMFDIVGFDEVTCLNCKKSEEFDRLRMKGLPLIEKLACVRTNATGLEVINEAIAFMSSRGK